MYWQDHTTILKNIIYTSNYTVVTHTHIKNIIKFPFHVQYKVLEYSPQCNNQCWFSHAIHTQNLC